MVELFEQGFLVCLIVLGLGVVAVANLMKGVGGGVVKEAAKKGIIHGLGRMLK